MKIGLYNKNFQMSEKEIEKDITRKVWNKNATFEVSLGPLVFDGETLKETYVLEIHYLSSKEAHRQTLPMGGFNSQIGLDYAEEAHKLASEFCEEENLVLNTHLNSFPEFQAIVSKDFRVRRRYC